MDLNQIKEAVERLTPEDTCLRKTVRASDLRVVINLASLVIECSDDVDTDKIAQDNADYFFDETSGKHKELCDVIASIIISKNITLTKKMLGLEKQVLDEIIRFCAVDGGFKITQFEKDMSHNIANSIKDYIGGKNGRKQIK